MVSVSVTYLVLFSVAEESVIMKKAEEYGIDPSRIHIDPIIEAAALMDPDREDGPGITINTKVIDAIRAKYPTIHITSAISNISHGLPARKYMNYAFASLVLRKQTGGRDSGSRGDHRG